MIVFSFEGVNLLHLYGPVVQLVSMPPCHGGGRGFESLLGRQIRSLSSAGRAPALQAGGHRFDPYSDHHLNMV